LVRVRAVVAPGGRRGGGRGRHDDDDDKGGDDDGGKGGGDGKGGDGKGGDGKGGGGGGGGKARRAKGFPPIRVHIDASSLPRRYSAILFSACFTYPRELVFFLRGSFSVTTALPWGRRTRLPPVDTYFLLPCTAPAPPPSPSPEPEPGPPPPPPRRAEVREAS